eukprot:8840214-Pyramimonas_sp.AAC.1
MAVSRALKAFSSKWRFSAIDFTAACSALERERDCSWNVVASRSFRRMPFSSCASPSFELPGGIDALARPWLARSSPAR